VTSGCRDEGGRHIGKPARRGLAERVGAISFQRSAFELKQRRQLARHAALLMNGYSNAPHEAWSNAPHCARANAPFGSG